jgi:hypothetical protein
VSPAREKGKRRSENCLVAPEKAGFSFCLLPAGDTFINLVGHEVDMDQSEAQARAIIAAALIVRGAVEVPAIPSGGHGPDDAGVRLRELTDYVYRLLTIEPAAEA